MSTAQEETESPHWNSTLECCPGETEGVLFKKMQNILIEDRHTTPYSNGHEIHLHVFNFVGAISVFILYVILMLAFISIV